MQTLTLQAAAIVVDGLCIALMLYVGIRNRKDLLR